MCVQPAQASLDANHARSKIIHPSHTDLILDILLFKRFKRTILLEPESKFKVRIKSKYHQSQIQIGGNLDP